MVYQKSERNETMTTDRKQRIAVAFKVSLKINSARILGKTKALNMGRGGLFISLEGGLPRPGDKVTFEIAVDEGSPICGAGVVRWVRSKAVGDRRRGFGLEFQEIAPNGVDKIQKLIEQAMNKNFIPME
jgi:Tfp pilus assembly protein PilZ